MSPYRQDIARHVIKTQKPCRTLYRYKFEIYSYSCCYYYYSLKVPWLKRLGRVAQWLARRTHNLRVLGLTPTQTVTLCILRKDT